MNAHRKRSVGAHRRTTVFGVFDDHYLAGQAVCELSRAGFGEKQIAVAHPCDQARIGGDAVVRSSGRAPSARATRELDAIPGEAGVGEDAPEYDPVKFPGLLRGDSSSLAGERSASALFAGDMRAAGVPEHEARYYHNEWAAGRTVVTVSSDGRSHEAMAILRRHGSYDMLSGIFSRTSV